MDTDPLLYSNEIESNEIQGNINLSQYQDETEYASSHSYSSSSFYTSDSENDFYHTDTNGNQQQQNLHMFDNKVLFPEIIVLGKTKFHRFIFLRVSLPF